MSGHTPTPWELHIHRHVEDEFWATIGYKGRGPIVDIIGEQGNKTIHYQAVAGMNNLVTPVDEQKSNAEFIVRACNAHDDLVSLLEKSFGLLTDNTFEGSADNKLAKEIWYKLQNAKAVQS